MSEDLREMLTEGALQVGDTVSGEATAVDENGVTVSLSHGYEGHISPQELSVLADIPPSDVVSVGEQITAVVKKIDMESGVVTLSKRQLESVKAWETMQHRFESGEAFEVVVRDVVKGGLVADVGVRGFIPASLIDKQFIDDLTNFKGTTIRVRVAEIDKENNRLILSRRAVLDEEANHKAKEVIESISVGDVLDGVVQRLTNFGAFVDIGGADGLVHVSEMAWHHVNHPTDAVREGEHVKVKVLRVDPEHNKISLSIKAASPGPWEQYVYEFQPGDVVNGVVKRVVDFGAFVELRPGLEGLVHVSQISNQHVEKATDALEPGQEVQVRVLAVEPERKRISLSMREGGTSTASTGGPRREREPKRHVERVQQEPAQSGTGATLGDLFGDLFK